MQYNEMEQNRVIQDEQPWQVEQSGNGNDRNFKQTQHRNNMGMRTNDTEKERCAEEVYIEIDEHMQKALALHEQLADYFCFLGLQGFKRKLEYQYMCEVAEKRKLHHKYTNIHHKIIPFKQAELPHIIPSDWRRYTTNDVNDNVLSRYVKNAMQTYKEWEEQTKSLYEQEWQKCSDCGLVADAEYIAKLVKGVTKEIKQITRMCEQLNGTGYEAVAIHSMQDKYHEKFKNKYEEEYTNKDLEQKHKVKNK